VECYRILSDFSNNPEKYLGTPESKESDPTDDVIELTDIAMEEDKNASKKRRISDL